MQGDHLRALNVALPKCGGDGLPGGGQGPYWRTEVEEGRCAYPPVPTATPPLACQQFGDRGRLYPAHYVTVHQPKSKRRPDPENKARLLPGRPRPARRVCDDCRQARILMMERRLYDETGYLRQDGSVSAETLRALATAGVEIVETKLPTESEDVLRGQIDRYLAGEPTDLIQPFLT